MTEGWAPVPSFQPSWKAPGAEGRRKEAVRQSRDICLWRMREGKRDRKAPSSPSLCLLREDTCIASQTLHSADTGTDLVYSLMNAGYESCLQVSLIKSLERAPCLAYVDLYRSQGQCYIKGHLLPDKI